MDPWQFCVNSARTPRAKHCHIASRNEMHRTKSTADIIPSQSEESNVNQLRTMHRAPGVWMGWSEKMDRQGLSKEDD